MSADGLRPGAARGLVGQLPADGTGRFVPGATTNGGISIRDVDGQIEFKTVNGGVKLVNLAGDVRTTRTAASTSISKALAGKARGLTSRPATAACISAFPSSTGTLETGTVNGGMNSDFPLTVQGRVDRQISANLGGGGAPIRVDDA